MIYGLLMPTLYLYGKFNIGFFSNALFYLIFHQNISPSSTKFFDYWTGFNIWIIATSMVRMVVVALHWTSLDFCQQLMWIARTIKVMQHSMINFWHGECSHRGCVANDRPIVLEDNALHRNTMIAWVIAWWYPCNILGYCTEFENLDKVFWED